MRNLVRRYVTVEQRKSDNQGVTEDDVNEIKQDISAFRCELIEVLKNSGMNTSTATGVGQGISFGSIRGKSSILLLFWRWRRINIPTCVYSHSICSVQMFTQLLSSSLLLRGSRLRQLIFKMELFIIKYNF